MTVEKRLVKACGGEGRPRVPLNRCEAQAPWEYRCGREGVGLPQVWSHGGMAFTLSGFL